MQLTECPRDSIQGIKTFIPTEVKINYLNKLLQVGFYRIDFGSFVSPKVIPQLNDTKKIVEKLDLEKTNTKLLSIVANIRGATQALQYKQISYLGYPLSISETFQQRNTNKTIASALDDVYTINNLCSKNNKTLILYLSMGFGNPFNDIYTPEILEQFIDILITIDVKNISLSDTIGIANSTIIEKQFYKLSNKYPKLSLGLHLHSSPKLSSEKIKAALRAGCKRFDGSILGYGGCPMANDELIGNIDTRTLISEIKKFNPEGLSLDMDAFNEAEKIASSQIFEKYH